MRPARPGTAPPKFGVLVFSGPYPGARSRSTPCQATFLRIELFAGCLVANRDRVHGAIRGRLDQVVAARSVRVDDDRLLVVVELEDGRLRADTVAKAVAKLAIDLDHDAFICRRSAAHTSAGSRTASASFSASQRLRSSRCRRETTRRCTCAVPSKIW